MNIIETIQVHVREATPADGRWLLVDAAPADTVTVNLTGRSLECNETDLRRLRAIANHLLEAEEVTNASLLAAIEAEFPE